MRRDDICLYLSPGDRSRLQAFITDRNTPRKLVWRAEIVLATADGHGTFEIMRRAKTSKPTVWRWQERYLDEGVDGLKRDKTRPSRVPPLPRETRLNENGSGIVDHGSGGDFSRCGRSKSRPVSALSVLISGGREHFHRGDVSEGSSRLFP